MSEAEPIATRSIRNNVLAMRRFEVVVIEGRDRGQRAVSTGDELTIGTTAGNDLQVQDPAVSRHHCVLRVCERGLELRDLGSTNGTYLGDSEIVQGYVKSGVRIRIGATTVEVALLDQEIEHPLATTAAFGRLLGASPAMRRLYAIVERFAQASSTVLIEGETGTGKELVAETIHELSPRRHGPLVVVDCGALPRELIESELFGHARGAFTGAHMARIGAFESAHGGTLVLDEIGELPLALQPALLRVLESRSIRPIGAGEVRQIDVRVLAATHRDLRVEVNQRRFRADLFYRLNVLRVVIPPLREREDDVRLLVDHFWAMLRPDSAPPAELVEDLLVHSWPGNVRELRNAVERSAFSTGPARPAPALSYGDAKEQALLAWERRWVEQLLGAHGGNLSRAARAAQMGRSNLRELARRHALLASERDDDQ
jgi:transcriptional regulator with GAF, ATPase, and Fis domain